MIKKIIILSEIKRRGFVFIKKMSVIIFLIFNSEVVISCHGFDNDSCSKKYKYIKIFSSLFNKNNESLSIDEKKHFVKLRRRVVEFGFDIFDEFKKNGDAFDLIDNPEKRKQLARIVYQYAKNNQEITAFTKNIIKIFAKILISLTNTSLQSPYYEMFQSADISFDEMAIMFKEYIPQGVDTDLAIMEYLVWAHSYLYRLIQLKLFFNKVTDCSCYDLIQNLSIDSGCYVMKQLGVYLKLPKKSQKFLNELVCALEQGLKDLPSEMKACLIKETEQGIDNHLVKDILKLIGSTAKIRKNMKKEIFENNDFFDNDDNDDNDELWDGFTEVFLLKMKKTSSLNSFLSKKTMSKYLILEKMLFKN